jgi:hypothetical protein
LLCLLESNDRVRASMSNIESKDPAEIVTDIEMVASDMALDAKHTHKVHWYRSTMFQAFVTGAASFMGVGLFNALSATGAGGLQNTYTGKLKHEPLSIPM